MQTIQALACSDTQMSKVCLQTRLGLLGFQPQDSVAIFSTSGGVGEQSCSACQGSKYGVSDITSEESAIQLSIVWLPSGKKLNFRNFLETNTMPDGTAETNQRSMRSQPPNSVMGGWKVGIELTR